MKRLGVRGEVIVADNGSTDGSQSLATNLGRELCRSRRADTAAPCAEALPPRAAST